MRQSLQIFAAWFLGGGLIGGSLIFLLQPMAGLFLLMVLATAISMTAAPIAHIFLRRRGVPIHEVISTLVVGLVALLFVLGFTGWFNFT